jgi:hypothetical protein
MARPSPQVHARRATDRSTVTFCMYFPSLLPGPCGSDPSVLCTGVIPAPRDERPCLCFFLHVLVSFARQDKTCYEQSIPQALSGRAESASLVLSSRESSFRSIRLAPPVIPLRAGSWTRNCPSSGSKKRQTHSHLEWYSMYLGSTHNVFW